MTVVTKYTSPDGKTFYYLPRLYANVTPLTAKNCLEHGWMVETENIADAPVTYSKLKIYRKMKELGLWETLKADIDTAGASEEWALAQDMSSEDSLFQSLLAVIEKDLPEGVSLSDLLEECRN